MSFPRCVMAETLDSLAADDPQAQRSRRDLRRIHRVMGSRAIVARGWCAFWPGRPPAKPLRVLELGAGDGTLLLAVARSLASDWPDVQLTLLDRQHLVRADTVAAYAELGWQVQVQVMDVLQWMQSISPTPTDPQTWDLIVCSLFLHHFEGPQLDALLQAIAACCMRFFAVEPRRARLALVGSHLVGLIGANAVTREDAVLSVRAGFRGQEVSQRWPGRKGHWLCREYTAGLFSHCFSAQRTGLR